MKESDRYPVFKIPGAIKAGGQFVMLHDTYTQLNIVSRYTYENPLSVKPNDEDHSNGFRKSSANEIKEFLNRIPVLYATQGIRRNNI